MRASKPSPFLLPLLTSVYSSTVANSSPSPSTTNTAPSAPSAPSTISTPSTPAAPSTPIDNPSHSTKNCEKEEDFSAELKELVNNELRWKISVSRVGKYQKCHYAFFLDYVCDFFCCWGRMVLWWLDSTCPKTSIHLFIVWNIDSCVCSCTYSRNVFSLYSFL